MDPALLGNKFNSQRKTFVIVSHKGDSRRPFFLCLTDGTVIITTVEFWETLDISGSIHDAFRRLNNDSREMEILRFIN